MEVLFTSEQIATIIYNLFAFSESVMLKDLDHGLYSLETLSEATILELLSDAPKNSTIKIKNERTTFVKIKSIDGSIYCWKMVA